MPAVIPVVAAESLTRRYGRRVGIENVDLAVGEGEIFGFLGPNGSGKTTTIRVLLGFLTATAGRARVFGLDCWRDSHRIKRDAGYLPGDLRLYPWLTGVRALRMASRLRGRDLRGPGARLAERFQLDLDVRVSRMSRGTRQKLGLVLALAHEPRLLVLDEPTASLDPLMQDELAACLRERASRGATVFFSSHTLSEVERLCDRVAIVRRGRIVEDAPLAELRRRARRHVTIVFESEQAAAATTAPPFLDVGERRGTRWSAEMDGHAARLARWAAPLPIADLTVEPPDLESLFRRHYGEPDEAPPGEGGAP
jgi:ABC-2 type transport system ATP-binding protein